MPHSTGGGGSHGGSHSSGGGGSHSGGSSRKVHYYHEYRPGSHVWVRYTDHGPIIRYTDTRYAKSHPVMELLWYTILAVIFGAQGVMLIISGLPPAKVTTGQTPLTIEDNADLFTDAEETELKNAVQNFYAETGIPVVMVTEDFEDWYTNHGQWGQTQEDYAMSMYLGKFGNDETKWLLVIWNGEMLSQYTKEYDLEAYSFEGIAGDDTSKMLPSNITDKFNSRVSYHLEAAKYSNGERSYTCAEAFLYGFDNFEDLGKGAPEFIAFGIVIIVGVTALALWLGSDNIKEIRKPRNPREEHEVNTKGRAPILVTCDYCGGTYVFGETSCPHCGSPGKTSPGPGTTGF